MHSEMLQTNSTLTYNILQAHMLVIRLQSISLYNTVLTFFLGVVECLFDVILIHVVDKQGARDKLGNAPHHKAHPYHDPQSGTRQVFKTHLWNITKKEHCIYETHCKSRDLQLHISDFEIISANIIGLVIITINKFIHVVYHFV